MAFEPGSERNGDASARAAVAVLAIAAVTLAAFGRTHAAADATIDLNVPGR